MTNDYPQPGDRVRLKAGFKGYPPLIVPGDEYTVGGHHYTAGAKSLGITENSRDKRDDAWWWRELELVEGPW